MDYLTNFYKNRCEYLQEQINLLEAGLKKALRSNDSEVIRKEMLKARFRRDDKKQKSRQANIDFWKTISGGALDARKKYESSADKLNLNIGKLQDRQSLLNWQTEPYPSPSQMTQQKMEGLRPIGGGNVSTSDAMKALGGGEDAEAAMMDLEYLGYVNQKPRTTGSYQY